MVGTRSVRPDGSVYSMISSGSADQLADTGFDVADLAENDLSEGDPIGDPVPFGFECFQNGVKTIPKIGKNVVVVE
jgi:hypothetical protein